MANFKELSNDDKKSLSEELSKYVEIIGGKNFFLNFLEDIRSCKPHPLISSYKDFVSDYGEIEWEKVIFKDKLDLLLKLRVNETKQDNLLPQKEQKGYKKAINLVKTLTPIEFKFYSMQNEQTFTIKPFIKINDDKTKLNPIFDIIFFSSIDNVKRVLNYSSKE